MQNLAMANSTARVNERRRQLAATVLDEVAQVAQRFAADRRDRQRRTGLDPVDFANLERAGFLLTGVRVQDGGLFDTVSGSARPIAEILRTLARGDPSVALVCSMHPVVLSFWLATDDVSAPHRAAWAEQRASATAMAASGEWFGTITSEPGSGGDVAQTTATARPGDSGAWLLSGQKHFGSGSGITSFMLTTARPEGQSEPDWFLLDMRGVPWDGSAGVTLVAQWDGHGMAATQSHAMNFADFTATRLAWPGNWRGLADAAGPFIASVFTAVILGVVESAMEEASAQLARRKDSLRPYEQVEWCHAEQKAWLMRQAYEGMLRAVETEPTPQRTILIAKTAAAELAEDCLRCITRIMGGGTMARHSPFGYWFEDVRALGFLRPQWGLAYDGLFASAWTDETPPQP
jgi:alkylation response protein AidB-like acyl-CoA dehydrogenase